MACILVTMDTLNTPEFLPIILGTDSNAYGVARSIHENYGISSVCLGKAPLNFTSDSRILSRSIDPNLATDEVFLTRLDELATRFPDLPKIIIPCGDAYAEQLSRNRETLTARGFLFNIITQDLQKRLEDKISFYQICEEYGLPYPETKVISPEQAASGSVQLPFQYPVALKASDSIEYLELSFPGKKKAYTIQDESELNLVLKQIYHSGYTGSMVAQDFIPGGPENMAVLNAYVNRQGKVRMMCFGQCVLDAVLPAEIGNYHALYSDDGSEIYPVYLDFLEKIGYRGFANFDLKRDPRDGIYKVFEINLRQGRSSYYTSLGGCEFITYLINDLLDLDDPAKPAHLHRQRGKMWLYVDPCLVRWYAPPAIRKRALDVMHSGWSFTQWYPQDRSVKRWLRYWRSRLSSIKSYLKYASRPPRSHV